MGTEAAASAVDLLRSQIPFQTDGELVLPPRGVGLVQWRSHDGFDPGALSIAKKEIGRLYMLKFN